MFNETYNLSGTDLDSCSICHGDSTLTPYGADVLASGLDFASIENNDSDEDGFSNIEEINALTSPGDPNDYPETMVEEETASEETSDAKSPGFEITFAIAGIAALTYLKRRR
ncbi:PGF-CTERM sorting domain-containing protein [Methanolobus sediminis]|uniref:PGF-CTERM sorting domain-containing protein n=1 Tax=Methanolobus sediminis TaxID=3072978 RepID=A0AA51UQ64_9EURY|nr:PGF-CTERM sorting domain-containing protein [Methanolobus sediminis]WMW26240.1 PGF-CTERM sorting domain-containing protein [Methanolobus sediminis]